MKKVLIVTLAFCICLLFSLMLPHFSSDSYAFTTDSEVTFINSENALTLTKIIIIPSAPDSLVAEAASSSQITLTWSDNSSNETGFYIERAASPEKFVQIASVESNTVTYTDVRLSDGTTYYYRVRAYNSAGNSGYSNEASATTLETIPTAPGKLVATAATADQIDLSWADTSTNESGFYIERATDYVKFSQIDTVDSDTTGYSDTGLSAGTTYYYRVRAYNSGGNSDYSNEASATTPETIPDAPSSLTAIAAITGQITLSWEDNSTNETGFYIECATDSTDFSEIDTVNNNITSYIDRGLVAGSTYYYRVRAYNSAGNSDYSNEASATIPTESTTTSTSTTSTTSTSTTSSVTTPTTTTTTTTTQTTSASSGGTAWATTTTSSYETVTPVETTTEELGVEPSTSPGSQFIVTSLTTSSKKVAPGEIVTIVATILNAGSQAGSYTAELIVNGKVEASKTLQSLAPGSKDVVEFEFTKDATGDYKVQIGDEDSSITVAKGFNWWIIIALIAVILVIGLIILIVRWVMK